MSRSDEMTYENWKAEVDRVLNATGGSPDDVTEVDSHTSYDEGKEPVDAAYDAATTNLAAWNCDDESDLWDTFSENGYEPSSPEDQEADVQNDNPTEAA